MDFRPEPELWLHDVDLHGCGQSDAELEDSTCKLLRQVDTRSGYIE
jgi:hypothetical protein